jgi:prepilin-type N-terminal cleavage/methylation domain-containing protein
MKDGFTLLEFAIVTTIILLLISLAYPIIVSIEKEHDKMAVKIAKNIPLNINGTIVYEGCEYMSFELSHSFNAYTHKGNCTNKIHSYKGE